MGKTTAALFFSDSQTAGTPAEVLARALHRLEMGHRRLRTEFAATLGLTNSEFNAITNIGQAREMTPKELSGSLRMTTGAVTAMLDRLENEGLVARRNNPTDRRSLLVGLTELGYVKLDWVIERYRDAIQKIVTDDTDFVSPAFIELLHSVGQSLTQEADELVQQTARKYLTV